MSRPWLSVAIATMKRWEFLKDTLPILLERPEIGEVIVCDETGEDVSEISQSPFAQNYLPAKQGDSTLQSPSSKAGGGFVQNPKLRLFINEKRLGIYENKCKAMRLATLPWVAVLDSDNVFPDSFFDVLEEKLDRSNPFCLVGSAEFLRIDQRTGATTIPTQSFSGQLVDATLWNRYMSDPQAFAKGWIHLANDGNWIVSKEAIQKLRSDVKSSDVYAADAIFMLHHWLSQGFQILYLEGLQYMHIVHNGSSWLQMESASMDVLNRMNWAISKN